MANDELIVDVFHENCQYLGNDAWDCGHIDNSEECDCHVCNEAINKLRDWENVTRPKTPFWRNVIGILAIIGAIVGWIFVLKGN